MVHERPPTSEEHSPPTDGGIGNDHDEADSQLIAAGPPEASDGFDGPRDGEFAGFHRTLTEESIPRPDAPWMPDIAQFALTFDGYKALGDPAGDMANATRRGWNENGVLPHDLIDLRSCLFFEQRRYRHFGWNPDEDAMRYIRALIEAIRERVVEAEGDRP